ncbi:hypothetical protein QG37_07433 [Candidozyma auris]|uniref:Uncharacterized protein n=1 Tax=Candidozyma auris TaxID=498019 RepID=A0A0L0NQK4_CANAR|nr:hypothetical protein QG37_07433 [[Candida] auris]
MQRDFVPLITGCQPLKEVQPVQYKVSRVKRWSKLGGKVGVIISDGFSALLIASITGHSCVAAKMPHSPQAPAPQHS